MSVTPSQIDRARSCLRLVGWDIADPQPYQQRPEAALGDEVHDGLEAYNKAGVNPEENPALSPLARELAVLALPYAPRPRSGRSEGWFNWTWDGIEFSGRVDWEGKMGELGQCEPTAGLPATVDYKTTKDSTYGVWGEEGHLQDTQSLLYAKRQLELSPEYAAVFNRWLYIRTPEKKKAMAMPSDAIMKREAVNEAFDRLVMPVARVVDRMKTLGPKLNVLALPPNPMHCSRYMKRDGSGACPNISRCAIDESTALRFATGEETYNMDNHKLGTLLTLLEGPGGVAPQGAPAPAAAAPANPFNPTVATQAAPALTAAPAAAAAPSFGGLTLAPAPSGPASLGLRTDGPVALPAPATPPYSTLTDPAMVAGCKAPQEAVVPRLAEPVYASAPLRAEPANVVEMPKNEAERAVEATLPDQAITPEEAYASDAELGRAVRVLLAAFKAAS